MTEISVDLWEFYTWGYQQAGDLLVEHGITQGKQNILVYPTVFLYRQYIELRLKEIIRNGNMALNRPQDFPKSHNIDCLWGKCRDILEELDKDELANLSKDERNKRNNTLNALEKDIKTFSEWDPTSQAFRYPADKNGTSLISVSDLKGINFRDLQKLVERISSYLEAISGGISECFNAKHEMYSYIEDEPQP